MKKLQFTLVILILLALFSSCTISHCGVEVYKASPYHADKNIYVFYGNNRDEFQISVPGKRGRHNVTIEGTKFIVNDSVKYMIKSNNSIYLEFDTVVYENSDGNFKIIPNYFNIPTKLYYWEGCGILKK
jgi:hypothetical protein